MEEFEMSAILQLNKRNKFGAVKQSYKGYHYDSKKEAQYAFELDMMKKEGKITEYKRQYRLSLDVNNIHIADYYVDFAVMMSDGSVQYHEVKGFATREWLLKWKLAQAIYSDNKFVLIK